MAQIDPFRGIGYADTLVSDMSLLLSPPYDIIDDDLQSELYSRSPFNVVRLEYGKSFPEDDENENRYVRAAQAFGDWLRRGVLARDDEPSLYVYRQYFEHEGVQRIRTALIVSLRVQDYDEGEVYPHEATLPKPKEDRLRLLRACRANFSPVFGLYIDPESRIDRLIAESTAGQPPAARATEDPRVSSALWPLREPGAITVIADLLKPLPVYIADGHHRYDTALQYSREMSLAGLHGFDRTLVALVNMHDEGLVVLPTHRVIRGLPGDSLSSFVDRVNRLFRVRELALGNGVDDSLSMLLGELRAEGRRSPSFIVLRRDMPALLLSLRPDAKSETESLLPRERSQAWKALDVSVLHHVLLKLGLAMEGTEEGGTMEFSYTQDPVQAWRMVNGGGYQMAALLNPTKPASVIEVARAGDKMPQKSTYFWPKLATGYVIHPLPAR